MAWSLFRNKRWSRRVDTCFRFRMFMEQNRTKHPVSDDCSWTIVRLWRLLSALLSVYQTVINFHVCRYSRSVSLFVATNVFCSVFLFPFTARTPVFFLELEFSHLDLNTLVASLFLIRPVFFVQLSSLITPSKCRSSPRTRPVRFYFSGLRLIPPGQSDY